MTGSHMLLAPVYTLRAALQWTHTHTQAGIHTHVDYLLSPNQSGCMNAILYVLKYNFEDKKKRKE